MKSYRLLWMAAIALTTFYSASLADTCLMSDKQYSAGSTICECPTLLTFTGNFDRGKEPPSTLKSRRLTCSANGEWKPDGSYCLEQTYSPQFDQNARDDFEKYQPLFCPKITVNQEEVTKALTANTEGFFQTAPRRLVVAALKVICARFNITPMCGPIVQKVDASSVP